MKRNSKSQLPPSGLRWILAQNVAALRDKKFHKLPNETRRNEALASMIKPTSKSQIQRIVKRKVAITIDLLERLAGALDVRPQDLVTPYFANTASAGRTAETENQVELHPKSNRPPSLTKDT